MLRYLIGVYNVFLVFDHCVFGLHYLASRLVLKQCNAYTCTFGSGNLFIFFVLACLCRFYCEFISVLPWKRLENNRDTNMRKCPLRHTSAENISNNL